MKNSTLIIALCAIVSINTVLPMKRPAEQELYSNRIKTRSMTKQTSQPNADQCNTKPLPQPKTITKTPYTRSRVIAVSTISCLSKAPEIVKWSDAVLSKQQKDIDVFSSKGPDLSHDTIYNEIMDEFEQKQDISYSFRASSDDKEKLVQDMAEWIESMPEPAKKSYTAITATERSPQVIQNLTTLLETPSTPIINRYQCQYCPKSFYKQSNLVVHTRIHTGEKPYICEFCDKPFIQQGNLNKHIEKMHAERKPYTCTLCNKSFVTQKYLPKHMKRCNPQGDISKTVDNEL